MICRTRAVGVGTQACRSTGGTPPAPARSLGAASRNQPVPEAGHGGESRRPSPCPGTHEDEAADCLRVTERQLLGDRAAARETGDMRPVDHRSTPGAPGAIPLRRRPSWPRTWARRATASDPPSVVEGDDPIPVTTALRAPPSHASAGSLSPAINRTSGPAPRCSTQQLEQTRHVSRRPRVSVTVDVLDILVLLCPTGLVPAHPDGADDAGTAVASCLSGRVREGALRCSSASSARWRWRPTPAPSPSPAPAHGHCSSRCFSRREWSCPVASADRGRAGATTPRCTRREPSRPPWPGCAGTLGSAAALRRHAGPRATCSTLPAGPRWTPRSSRSALSRGGRRAGCDGPWRSRMLDDALALWRGPAYGEFADGRRAPRRRPGELLEELRGSTAWEDRADALRRAGARSRGEAAAAGAGPRPPRAPAAGTSGERSRMGALASRRADSRRRTSRLPAPPRPGAPTDPSASDPSPARCARCTQRVLVPEVPAPAEASGSGYRIGCRAPAARPHGKTVPPIIGRDRESCSLATEVPSPPHGHSVTAGRTRRGRQDPDRAGARAPRRRPRPPRCGGSTWCR